MRWLVDLCVRHAGTLATLTLLALVLGIWATRSAPLDVFPEFVPSTVDIQTEAPGFTAQQVEQLVTKPIENAVNGANGLSTILNVQQVGENRYFDAAGFAGRAVGLTSP